MRAILLLVVLLIAVPADASLSRADLSKVALSPSKNARLDLTLTAPDAEGRTRKLADVLAERPAFLTFVDYTCNTLCGTDIQLIAAAIGRAGLTPNSYRFVVIGIDPKDNALSAKNMFRREVPEALRTSTIFLLPDRNSLARATNALGFHYVYDASADQFAHPAAVYIIARGGAVRSVQSPFELNLADLSALLAAPPPSLSIYNRVRLFCYAYNPATGIYSLRINRLLQAAGLLTVTVLGSAVYLLIRAARKTA
jgi:protein SCO1/2